MTAEAGTAAALPDRGGWWALLFISAVESTAFTDISQLDSGRSLARRGGLGDVDVEPASARARPAVDVGAEQAADADAHEPRATTTRGWVAHLGVRPLAQPAWQAIIQAVADRPAVSAQLLTGVIPAEVATIADAVSPSTSLGLQPGDLAPDCSCPDWHEPCKHTFALCFELAQMIEADPWLYFLLRGIDRQRFLDELRQQRAGGANGTATSHEPRGADPGAPAAAAHRSKPAPIPRPHRRRPLVPGRPMSVLPPPADSGLTHTDLQHLVADASARALAVLVDDTDSALGLDAPLDAVRRCANDPGLTPRVLRMFNVRADELERSTIAWNVGGAAAVVAAETEIGLAPIDEATMAEAIAVAEVGAGQCPAGSTLRRNRVSLPTADGERASQLRTDGAGRWWWFEADDRLGWILTDGPFASATEALA